jgi:pimeloyl-ACP methyl ester carboxylesterase
VKDFSIMTSPLGTLPVINEFELVAQEADQLGITAPLTVQRTTLGALSALNWKLPSQDSVRTSLVFLHGAALNAHTWDSTLLTWGHPALAFDLPGHGESQWRADADYSPPTLAKDLSPALVQALEQKLIGPEVTLVGQSLGGLSAVELGHLLPDLVTHIILVDILPLPPRAAQTVADFLAGPTVFESREQIVTRAREHGFGGSDSQLRRGVIHNTRVRTDGSVVWKHHFGALSSEAHGFSLRLDQNASWESIASLSAAVDLIWGTQGLTTEESRNRLQKLHPRTRLVEVAAGHNIQEEQPRVLASHLADLI